MNKNLLFYGAISIALLSLCFLFIFRIIPTAQVWEKYNVLYVDVNIDVEEIRQVFTKHAIEGVLYPDHDIFPAPSFLAPVQYHQFSTGFSFEDIQTSYFFDKDKNFFLYYIPEEYTNIALEALKNTNFTWGIDAQATIPAIPFIVTFVLTLFLFFSCKNKLYFLSLVAPFNVYCLSSPFYHTAVTVCIFSLAAFIIQKYWQRDYFIQNLRKNVFLIISIALLFTGSLLLGFRGFFLFLISLLLSISLMYIVYTIKKKQYDHSIFKPKPIHSAKTIRTHTIFNIKYVTISLTAILILIVFALLSSQPQKKITKKALHIPSPSGYTITGNFSDQSYEKIIHEEVSERLPDLSDIISTAWHFETYPYVRLSDTSSGIVLPGTAISHTEYIKSEFGLEPQLKTIAIFDDAYIQRIVTLALSEENAGAEKLLASQKGFSRVTYAESGTIATPKGTIVFLLLMCAYMFYVLIALKVKRH